MHKIINAAFSGRFNDYDFLLDIAHAVPGTGLELSIYSHKPDFMACQQAAKARFDGIPLTFHGPFEDVEAASAPGTLERQRFIDAWRYALDVYEDFGGESIVMHTHKMKHINPDDMPLLRAYATEAIQEIAAEAVARKIRLTVENVGYWNVESVLFNEEQYIALFDQLPQEVGSLIDVGHAVMNRWDVAHVVHKLNKRIFSYHLHNNNGCRDSHRPMFEDGNRYDAEEMTRLLLLTNCCSPDADWILEYAYGDLVTKELLTHDLAYLASLNK